ncbi:MAG: ABC transporter permease, partial [Microvirga sp.]
MSAPLHLPRWADTVLVPAISVVAAFLVAGLVVLGIGENPLSATRYLIQGSLGTSEGLGFTLFYMTDFIFVGLAVAVAYHAGLFNIGGEGQATLAGLGIALVLNNLTFLPGFLLIPLGILGAAAFGAAWAAVPGYLQAKRGSHIVITTIMFNFIASALMVYLLVNVLIAPGSMTPETRELTSGHVPFIHDLLAFAGITTGRSPLNASVFLAMASCVFVWVLLWHTPWGFELRAIGHNAQAAAYAGIKLRRVTML